MEHIPIENLNLPQRAAYPTFITKNGRNIGIVFNEENGEELLRAFFKESFRASAQKCSEQARKNGLTPEILQQLISEIS